MRTWLLFAVMQTVIIGGMLVFYVEILEPTMEEPVGLHVPMMLGTLFALGVTYAITDISDWLARRRAACRDRDRNLKRTTNGVRRIGRGDAGIEPRAAEWEWRTALVEYHRGKVVNITPLDDIGSDTGGGSNADADGSGHSRAYGSSNGATRKETDTSSRTAKPGTRDR
jgi:hypothetical protein